MPTRRGHDAPRTDPDHVQDVFVTSFEVQDWEDWVRLTCWVDMVEPIAGDGESRAEQRKRAALVMPRSSVPSLIRTLRASIGPVRDARRHS